MCFDISTHFLKYPSLIYVGVTVWMPAHPISSPWNVSTNIILKMLLLSFILNFVRFRVNNSAHLNKIFNLYLSTQPIISKVWSLASFHKFKVILIRTSIKPLSAKVLRLIKT